MLTNMKYSTSCICSHALQALLTKQPLVWILLGQLFCSWGDWAEFFPEDWGHSWSENSQPWVSGQLTVTSSHGLPSSQILGGNWLLLLMSLQSRNVSSKQISWGWATGIVKHCEGWKIYIKENNFYCNKYWTKFPLNSVHHISFFSSDLVPRCLSLVLTVLFK